LIENAGIDSLAYDERWGRYRLRLKRRTQRPVGTYSST